MIGSACGKLRLTCACSSFSVERLSHCTDRKSFCFFTCCRCRRQPHICGIAAGDRGQDSGDRCVGGGDGDNVRLHDVVSARHNQHDVLHSDRNAIFTAALHRIRFAPGFTAAVRRSNVHWRGPLSSLGWIVVRLPLLAQWLATNKDLEPSRESIRE